MLNLSPNAIVLLVVFSLTLIGLVVAHLRDRSTYTGYEHISGEALRLRRKLDGEIFRDGADLVISGTYREYPVVVRFSQAENTPGMNLRMSATTNFTLWIEPKCVPSNAGRVLLRTTDFAFDSHFTCTSNHPQEAGLFLKLDTIRAALHRLMRSQQTFFTLSPSSLEMSELTIPHTAAAHYVLECLGAMYRLAASAATGEESKPVTRPSLVNGSLVTRVSIAIGVITAILVIAGAAHGPGVSAENVAPQPPRSSTNTGIAPIDEPLIRQASRYRAATDSDLAPEALGWLRQAGEVKPGRVPGDFSGTHGEPDVAYLLIGEDGKRRVVLLAGRTTKFDAEYPQVGAIARIPRERLDSVKWLEPKPVGSPDGDGLLVVRNPGDPASALVIYLSSGQVVSGVPQDYQRLSLQ